eukprot:CAMPEP_0118704528 /NCGR_PEP_ID=MMETSP0800-20121206/19291_1 /TAXON_ID=210618 ORGANISM="Striatella unipunctata, Strain CCMP2910" /NCGR_SAMPLE_ID=MMETSP0800 /ASSEMBLY_ACC=CAM_ASM_000638 /LENGTH=271 /DNA_ID=CAMNT_0006606439 /DNA_START=70 /DNA_END=885 /DNA_ORIENTATION=+
MVRQQLLATIALLSTPVVAQFGVGKKRQPGATFEEIKEQAAADGGLPGLEDFFKGDADMDEMMKNMANVMNDPEMSKMLEGMTENVGQVLEEMSKMSPEELMEQMKSTMEQMTDGDILQSVLSNKEEVLSTLEGNSLVDKEKLETYKTNPAAFEEDMKQAFEAMKEVFMDPETMGAALDLMKMAGDPSKLMKNFAEQVQADLTDDVKIEEARLKLLEDPSMLNDPMLAQLFQNEDMKELLSDPEKWRITVLQGQNLLMGEDDGTDGSKDEL